MKIIWEAIDVITLGENVDRREASGKEYYHFGAEQRRYQRIIRCGE